MKPYYADDDVTLYAGDCIEVMRGLPDNSVDAVVTDPPYGLEFMGKEWDAPWKHGFAATGYSDGKRMARPNFGSTRNPVCRTCRKHQRGRDRCICTSPDYDERPADSNIAFQAWCVEWASEALRVLKPGGHLVAFGGTRTWHRLACAIEDAGFEIRDSLALLWMYGSGFPKSLDVSKAIDKAAGAQREVVGTKLDRPGYHLNGHDSGTGALGHGLSSTTPETRLAAAAITAPATPAAQQWQGWGTALKPAYEPIVLARKPLSGTVAENVLAHGTGALNIDGCRVGTDVVGWHGGGRSPEAVTSGASRGGTHGGYNYADGDPRPVTGRWPANVILDEAAAAMLDQQSGPAGSNGMSTAKANGKKSGVGDVFPMPEREGTSGYDTRDAGGASRFFYTAKAGRDQRPSYYRPTCECEDAWPTTSPPRATAATPAADGSNTLKSGNATTANQSPRATKSTTSTATNSTTTPPTSSPSPQPTTSASTAGANSATANGGSPAASAESSSPSPLTTGTSAAKGGRSMAAVDRATSQKWSQTSVCGVCGAPSKLEAHATVKPLDLMCWLVRLCCPPGGVVLEPFAGSGTTAEACVVEGFKCIAIEREPDYLPLIVQRLSKPIERTLL